MASSPVVGILNLNDAQDLNDAQAILFRTLQQIISWSDEGDFIMTKANEEKTGLTGQDRSCPSDVCFGNKRQANASAA